MTVMDFIYRDLFVAFTLIVIVPVYGELLKSNVYGVFVVLNELIDLLLDPAVIVIVPVQVLDLAH